MRLVIVLAGTHISAGKIATEFEATDGGFADDSCRLYIGGTQLRAGTDAPLPELARHIANQIEFHEGAAAHATFKNEDFVPQQFKTKGKPLVEGRSLDEPISHIHIVGLSRGGVTALLLTKLLNQSYPNLPLCCHAIEPTPGMSRVYGDSVETEAGLTMDMTGLTESVSVTVDYAIRETAPVRGWNHAYAQICPKFSDDDGSATVHEAYRYASTHLSGAYELAQRRLYMNDLLAKENKSRHVGPVRTIDTDKLIPFIGISQAVLRETCVRTNDYAEDQLRSHAEGMQRILAEQGYRPKNRLHPELVAIMGMFTHIMYAPSISSEKDRKHLITDRFKALIIPVLNDAPLRADEKLNLMLKVYDYLETGCTPDDDTPDHWWKALRHERSKLRRGHGNTKSYERLMETIQDCVVRYAEQNNFQDDQRVQLVKACYFGRDKTKLAHAKARKAGILATKAPAPGKKQHKKRKGIV